jgi:hypothetical protein
MAKDNSGQLFLTLEDTEPRANGLQTICEQSANVIATRRAVQRFVH